MNIYASMCSREAVRRKCLGCVDVILHGNGVSRRANSSFTSTWHHLVTIIIQSGHFWHKKEMTEGGTNYRKIAANK